MITIAVDLMGADKGAPELVKGVAEALEKNPDLFVALFGDDELFSALDKLKTDQSRIERICAPAVIENDEDPLVAFGEKKDSSMVCAFDKAAKGEAEAVVTCGSTGAIFVSAMMSFKKVGDPTLLCELKKADGRPFCIADCGANVDCRAEKLVTFSRMGVAYMKAIGIEKPKIAMLSNGAESGKGNKLVKSATSLFADVDGFIGNVEGTHVLTCDADVIVCEGFAGNILLKTLEGTAKAVALQGRKILVDKFGDDKAAKAAFDELYSEYDYTDRGGAVLLGFEKPIIKGHGAASAKTIECIVEKAYEVVKNGLPQKVIAELLK